MLKARRSDKTITIFEGPDGSGKTTLAKKYAEETGALYVHFDALMGVQNIHRYFLEAMLPALLGYQSVVFDRCWHSGPIYDKVFRNLEESEQRLSKEICVLLDRAASFCKGVYVNCRPCEETCINNWKSRLSDEMVKSELEMRAIYKLYGDNIESINLPVIRYDYENPGRCDGPLSRSIIAHNILSERVVVYNQQQPRIHVMISSSIHKTDIEPMIDIPGVRFHHNSNEFKTAKDFVEHKTYDGVTSEEVIDFIDIDEDLFKYFSAMKYYGKQFIIAIGTDAVEKAMSFAEKNRFNSDLPDIFIVTCLNTLVENSLREARGMITISETVRNLWDSLSLSCGNRYGIKFPLTSDKRDYTISIETPCVGVGGYDESNSKN